MKPIIFAAIFASLSGAMANSPNQREIQAFKDMVQIVSRCLLDPDIVIVIAESRYDKRLRDPEEKFASKIKHEVRSVLGLRQLFPVSYLRGTGADEMLNIQVGLGGISREGPQRHYFPKFSEQGTWLYFIKPVEKLPEVLLKTTSEISTQFEKMDPSTPPHKAAEMLGIDSWLNRSNWYELAEPYSAVLIGFSVRELPLKHSYDPRTIKKVMDRTQEYIARDVKSDRPSRSVILTSQQLEQIEKLAQIFSPGRELPSAQELINLNSPFADAILKELATKPPDQLSEGLEQVP